MTHTEHDAITREIIRQWCGKDCWLDDKPAIVAGRKEPFALIATKDGSQSIQFSWYTVNRIMQHDKEFQS